MSCWVLKTSESGDYRMPPGNLLQCLTTMTVKKVFFSFLFLVCACCLVSFHWIPLREVQLCLPYHLSHQIFIYIDKISSFFLKINYFCGPLGLLKYIPICMEEPTAGCSTPDVHHQCWVEQGYSFEVLTTLLLMQQKMLLDVFVARAPVQLGT